MNDIFDVQRTTASAPPEDVEVDFPIITGLPAEGYTRHVSDEQLKYLLAGALHQLTTAIHVMEEEYHQDSADEGYAFGFYDGMFEALAFVVGVDKVEMWGEELQEKEESIQMVDQANDIEEE